MRSATSKTISSAILIYKVFLQLDNPISRVHVLHRSLKKLESLREHITIRHNSVQCTSICCPQVSTPSL